MILQAPARTLRVLRSIRGLGDAISDAAAAADAFRGAAPTPQPPCPWGPDNSYTGDPAGQILVAFFGPNTFNIPYGTMYADAWRDTINYSASGSAALAGRTAPGSSQLGLTAAQLNCTYDMELTLGQYWAAFKAYNAGSLTQPGQMCPGTPVAKYGPSSTVLYPNVNISPTWSGNAAPAGVTAATVQQQYAATQAAQAAGGGSSLVFSTPRNGGPLYVGDAWTIKISGAAPNSAVAVTGNSSPATYGTNVTTPMGTTDSSGNWSLSGTMASSSVGQWYENWSVGGKSVGSFSFQVLATPAPVANGSQGPAPAPSGTTPSSGTATTPASVIPSWFTETTIDGIPNWLLAVGAVGVGWFLLKGKM